MCKTFNDVNELIDFLNNLINEHSYVFRGYSYEKEMLPSIMRKSFVDKEIELISNFEKYAQPYLNANNVADMLSYAQHYGLPTRLLDFTYNPFIALFFAIYNEKDKEKFDDNDERNYYYMRYAKLDDNVIIANRLSGENSMNDSYYKCDSYVVDFERIISSINNYCTNNDARRIKYFNQLSNKIKDNYPLKNFLFLLDANLSNPRLVMQQGLFMFPYTLNEEEHKTIINSNTTKIKIDKNLRNELLTYLGKIGVNTFKLMPDLTSVCREIVKINS